MFTLVTDRNKYFRVKRGQCARDIESHFGVPVLGGAFAGRIIEVGDKTYSRYTADVGDTYRTVALKFGVDEKLLEEANGNAPVYPTKKLFVPFK